MQWHGKYSPQRLNPEQIILLEEKQQLLIEVPPLEELMPPFQGTLSQDQILQKINLLSQLRKQGYLRTEDSFAEDSTYSCPDFSQAPLKIRNDRQGPDVTILSQFEDKELLSDWCKKLVADHPLSIVIVDDYLDPRLEKLNVQLLQEKQPWLLVKFTGAQFFIGPYFSPQNENAACWQCLNHRMLRNQPVREWLRRKNDNVLSPIPVQYDRQRIEERIPILQETAQSLITSDETGYFFLGKDEEIPQEKHPVISRPQCPACGKSDLYARQCSQPVVLQPSIKTFTEDGGARSLSPEQTLNALSRDVSPVSGAIHPLVTFSAHAAQANQIFRSSLFRIPPPADRLDSDPFLQITMGKGITPEQSRTSALAEAVERLAGKYQGDEPYSFSLLGELDKRAFPPQELMPFSERQYQEFEQAYHAGKPPIHAALRYPAKVPLPWTPVWSLTQEELCYAPFTFCYADSPFPEKRYAPFFHSGGAAGNSLEEAVLQGIFEVIERDAVAVWWYNRLRRPAVDHTTLSEKLLSQMEYTIGRASDYWVLDLTHDFEIPVFAVVSQHRSTRKFCLGFGCHLDPELACKRALTELCQTSEIRNQHSAPFEFDAIAPEPYLFPAETPARSLRSFSRFRSDDIQKDILHCVERLAQLDIELLVLDCSRPDLALRTVKILAPGLCHIFPYFAAERLYRVPVSMNWRTKMLIEEELNPQLLLI